MILTRAAKPVSAISHHLREQVSERRTDDDTIVATSPPTVRMRGGSSVE
jgi:hypothetical protein